MTTTRPEFLAADFLADDVLAMDPLAARRLEMLVRAFVAGQIDAPALSASLRDYGAAPHLEASGGVAVIPLRGVLTPHESFFTWLGLGTSVHTFMRSVTAAAADPSVTAILVDVDSPGGSIGLIPEAAALVRAVRAQKPVVVATGGHNASAAYWITSNATRIEATPSARIGSVGIIGERVSLVKHYDQEGIQVDVVSSSPAKAWGHPATAVSDEERTHMRAQIAELHVGFTGDVALGRGVSRDVVHRTYGDGRCLTAREALRVGMIDRVALVDDTLARTLQPPTAAHVAAVQASLSRQRARLSAASLRAPRAALAATIRGRSR